MDTETQSNDGVKSSPYQSPMYNYGGSIVLLTNPENDLYKLELSLRNIRLDDKGNPITNDKNAKAMMNEKGVQSVLSIIQSVVNQVTIMSNLSQNDIPMLIELMSDAMIKDLMVNSKDYGIDVETSRDKIVFMSSSFAFVCMKRAFEEGEKHFWKGSQQEITMTNQSGQQKRSLASFFGFNQQK